MLFIGCLLIFITEKAKRRIRDTEPSVSHPAEILDLPMSQHRPFITHFRAFVNIAAAIMILAVDFQVFPRNFCKTETYGTGLMDIGVGGFIVSNGIVSPEARGKFKMRRSLLTR
jgi:phosphatidylinositol glycan class W